MGELLDAVVHGQAALARGQLLLWDLHPAQRANGKALCTGGQDRVLVSGTVPPHTYTRKNQFEYNQRDDAVDAISVMGPSVKVQNRGTKHPRVTELLK